MKKYGMIFLGLMMLGCLSACQSTTSCKGQKNRSSRCKCVNKCACPKGCPRCACND